MAEKATTASAEATVVSFARPAWAKGWGERKATLHLHLKADSGFTSESQYRVSPEEWAAISRIVEGLLK